MILLYNHFTENYCTLYYCYMYVFIFMTQFMSMSTTLFFELLFCLQLLRTHFFLALFNHCDNIKIFIALCLNCLLKFQSDCHNKQSRNNSVNYYHVNIVNKSFFSEPSATNMLLIDWILSLLFWCSLFLHASNPQEKAGAEKRRVI